MSSLSFPLPPLPPTRYFDLLPTELVRDIFQDVDNFPRRERQAALLSLCLTSKLLRSHAQPLLLKRVYTSVGAGQDILKLLVENNSAGSLATVQALIFDIPDLKKVSKWLKMFVQKATNLQEAYINKQMVPLKAFVGSNITTLSLRNITMKLDGATFAFPELRRLSMTSCPIHNEGGIRCALPKLKHLAYFANRSHLYPQEYEFLNCLAPDLISFTVSLIQRTALPPSILASPSLTILYEFYIGGSSTPHLEGVQHLDLGLWTNRPNAPAQLDPLLNRNLESWASLIENSVHLESVSLALCGGGVNVHPHLLPAVTALVAACESRNIEVCWRRQGEVGIYDGSGETFDDLVPPTFISMAEARYARIKGGEVNQA